MFTETELREAMQHAAARADDLIAVEQHPSTESMASRTIDQYLPIDLVPEARRRTWLPVSAAAAVVAVAAGGLFVAAKPAHRSPASPQKGVAAATAPASPNSVAVAAPRTAVTITNLVTIPGDSGYTLNGRTETVSPPLGGVQVMVLPAGGFDPAKQLTGAHTVPVAGTHGYAGKALIYLIDPHDAQQASKAGRPRNTVAWLASDGTWLVLQNIMADDGDFADVPVATLVHDAGQLGVQAAPAPLRSGYRAGWLPSGLTLTRVDASVGNPAVTLTLTAGKKSITIQLAGTELHSVSTNGGAATKHIPGYWVSVFGTGYDKATAQRVLDGLDFSRLHGPQSGWWTFDQAVNG